MSAGTYHPSSKEGEEQSVGNIRAVISSFETGEGIVGPPPNEADILRGQLEETKSESEKWKNKYRDSQRELKIALRPWWIRVRATSSVRTTLPGLADKKKRSRDVDELARKLEAQQREIDATKEREASNEIEREEAREREALREAWQKQMQKLFGTIDWVDWKSVHK